MSAYDEAVAAMRRLSAVDARVREPLRYVMERLNAIEERRVALEAALAAGGGGGAQDPDEGAQHVAIHVPGRALRETLAAMALAPALTPGGLSVLHLPAGDHGPLQVGYAAGDRAWAARLLKGRTLRVVGSATALISGTPAIGVYASAGDLEGCTLEVWRVGIQGDVQAFGQRGFTFRPLRGAAIRSATAAPATGTPL